jgi:hypothetical protein
LVAEIIAGLLSGIRAGINPSVGGIVVPTDGPDGWYVPTEEAHFTALGLAVPDYLWLCQEASGDLENAIGASVPLEVSGASGHLYEQTVTDWTRVFVGTTGGIASEGWRTSAGVPAIGAGVSMALVALAAHTAASLAFLVGSSTDLYVRGTGGSGILRIVHGSVGFNGAEDHSGIDTVHQICQYRNATTDVSGVVTDLESIVATHEEDELTGFRGIGAPGAGNGAPARVGWLAIYIGANAEQDWSTYLATLRNE